MGANNEAQGHVLICLNWTRRFAVCKAFGCEWSGVSTHKDKDLQTVPHTFEREYVSQTVPHTFERAYVSTIRTGSTDSASFKFERAGQWTEIQALWHSRLNPVITNMFKRKAVPSSDPDVGLICKACAEAKIVGDFSTGKKWSDGWKLDYLKRHLISKVHESAMVILRNRSAAARFGFGVRAMLTETVTDKANRMEVVERQRFLPEEIKILINNVLLAMKMNTSMLSVQDIHDHLALYVKIPDSWRSKNYAFEFLEAINSVIHCEGMAELRNALYHTLIIDESTDISVTKMLILYFKFRPVTSTEHKTLFGGIVKLTSCNAEAITTAVKEFYTANELDLMKMVMFTSDCASVMLGKNNGVATRLKQSIPRLVEQHCVAHREDLGVDDAWKRVPMIKEMETLLRTVYTVFSRSPARKSKLDEMASVTDCEVVSFRPLNEVRWLSRHFAVGALIRNFEAVLKYFEHEKVEENDPVAKYCYKKLYDSNYRELKLFR
ncbi:zinc finger protein 862-like [Lissotriton helveticus]